MVRPTRNEQFVASEDCIIHAAKRCVRRAFLTGVDEKSGADYACGTYTLKKPVAFWASRKTRLQSRRVENELH
jgi:hypothetical protein